MSAEAVELRRIRDRMAALAETKWFRSADARGEFLKPARQKANSTK